MKKKNYILPLAAALCILSLAVMLIALSSKQEPTIGEFTPPPFDAAAQTGTPAVPDGLGYGELDCQAYKVSLCGKLNESGDIYLTNPESNTVWLKVRVLDEKGNILGETGLVKPGEYVQSVTLATVPEPESPVTLKIMAYEPETYYSAGAVALNTTIG